MPHNCPPGEWERGEENLPTSSCPHWIRVAPKSVMLAFHISRGANVQKLINVPRHWSHSLKRAWGRMRDNEVRLK